jgi:hypothetical protein
VQSEVLGACCRVITLALDNDKIAQVSMSASALLPAAVSVSATGMRKAELHSALDGVVTALVNKLGDSNPRTRDAVVQSLLDLAALDVVGAEFIASHVVKPLPKKQASAWKPLKLRLEVVYQLVEGFGLGPYGALSEVCVCVWTGVCVSVFV